MWIFKTKGFVSVVEHRDDMSRFLVRARDYESLIPVAEATGGDIQETKNADYRFRINVDREAFNNWVSDQVKTIDYDNFKNEADGTAEWHEFLMNVWHSGLQFQERAERQMDLF